MCGIGHVMMIKEFAMRVCAASIVLKYLLCAGGLAIGFALAGQWGLPLPWMCAGLVLALGIAVEMLRRDFGKGRKA